MKHCRRFITLIIIFSACWVCSPLNIAIAQDNPAKVFIGDQFDFYSEVLGENRNILIFTPQGYEINQNSYPVIYLLDGSAHFIHAAGLVHFLSQNDRIPQMIMVAIPNTDRPRDLTPTRVEVEGRETTSGGGDNFLKFLETELKPKIDSMYRTSPYDIMIGHSLAGGFVGYTIAAKPDLFNSYISISPSFNWDNEFITKRVENFFRTNKDYEANLYITFANETGDMKESMDRFVKLLETSAPENLNWEFSIRPEQSHGSVVHNSIYDGLEFIYSDWPIPDEIITKNDLLALKGHFERRSANLGYVVMIPENTLNMFGYRLVQNKQFDEAISAFKLNVKNYPNSANVYDSLGDGLDAAGRTQEAYESYKQAYENGIIIEDPNTQIYKQNMDRAKKVLETGGEKIKDQASDSDGF